MTTAVALVPTDLPKGIGLVVGIFHILRNNMSNTLEYEESQDRSAEFDGITYKKIFRPPCKSSKRTTRLCDENTQSGGGKTVL